MLFVKNRWKIKLPELKIYQKHFSTVNQEALKACKDYESSWGTLRLIILFLLLYLFNLLYSFIFYYLIYLFNLFYLFYLFNFSFILYYISSNPFSTNVLRVDPDLMRALYSLFYLVLCFKWSVIKHCVVKNWLAIQGIFFYETVIPANLVTSSFSSLCFPFRKTKKRIKSSNL